MMNLFRKIRWIWACLIVTTKGFAYVGNRTVYKGTKGHKEVTIISKDLSKPDAYSREELLKMLELIRVHEEIMQWQVPEVIRCGYCGHCSPTDENGYCPVVMNSTTGFVGALNKRKPFPCPCPTHQSGLNDARKAAIDKALNPSGKRSPESDFTISPSEASSEALNG